VLLCHPWGVEYLAAHRSMRQLAWMLSAAGVHTLRFDYFGTGDSAGDMRQADLAGWQDDIEMAVEELKDTSGAMRVGLAGLRLGATLAAGIAARLPGEVEALALWDPIASGKEYLEDLMKFAEEEQRARNGAEAEIGGFALTPRMAREMEEIDLAASAATIQARTLVVLSEEQKSCEAVRSRLAGRFRGPFAVEQVAAPPVWVEDVSIGTGAVPAKVLQRVVEWFR
jgi:pimeloyl-ACP methyl ester carboxylesterase